MPQFSIISSVLLASLICGGCSDSHRAKSPNDLADDEIRGRVVSTDLNKSLISVEVLSAGRLLRDLFPKNVTKTMDFHAQPGDLSFLNPPSVFRAKAQETFTTVLGKSFLLNHAWPDNRSDRIRLNNVNRLLRRDTLSIDKMIRMVRFRATFSLYDQNGEIITSSILTAPSQF